MIVNNHQPIGETLSCQVEAKRRRGSRDLTRSALKRERERERERESLSVKRILEREALVRQQASR